MGRKLFFFEIWKTIDHRIKKSFKAAAAGPMESITREMYIFFNNQRTTINKLNNLKPINPVEKKKKHDKRRFQSREQETRLKSIEI